MEHVTVRRLYPHNQQDICEHFLRLDASSRRARFCGSVSDAGVLKYANGIFRYDSVVCGALINHQLRGLVELRGVFHGWRSPTEAAFSIETDWQNMGLGDVLFERMFTMAQNRGVRTIQMMCLKENNRMKHLAAKHHALLHYDQNEVAAVLHPFWPTPASMAKELIGEIKSYV